ncbi:MAG: thymidylate synthase [Pseudomonadota bacterium]
MTRLYAGIAVLAALAACGNGSPFNGATGGDTDTGGGSTIPESLASDLGSFTYDPAAGTLTVQGLVRDEDPFNAVFRRRPALDRPGYVAFSAQDDPLDQHVTAYVQDIGGTRAGIAVSGGQFTFYNAGGAYARDGNYDPVEVQGDSGLVTYAGDYVGLTNLSGDNTDLAPIPTPGITPGVITPGQSAVVTGQIFINVDFADNNLSGAVYNRVLDANDAQLQPPATTLAVGDLVFEPTTIDGNGEFFGNVELAGDRQDRGDYGGIFGGQDANAVAGVIFVTDHLIDSSTDEEEYGVFVLGRCGGPNQSAQICNDVEP